MPDRLYLDHAATTPMRPEAIAAVAKGMARWANPSSPHGEGRAARRMLEDARARIARALEWDGEVILTSGASEAIAIAIGGREVIASATEHDTVLRHAGKRRLRVGTCGRATFPSGGGWVAIQSANSETGVLQPLDDRDGFSGVLVADCSQTAGKLPLPDADLIVVSAHKLGGPPGVGALLVRDLSLLRATGGQEQGYRGGTENVPAILGFAAALEADWGWFDAMPGLRRTLDTAIVASGGVIVAADTPRIATIGGYRLPGLSASALLVRLDMMGIAVSAGSACSSGTLKTSHVLSAMGMPANEASEVVRVSLGWTSTADDVARFADAWTQIARERRGT